MFDVVTVVFGLGCPIFCLACVLEPTATLMPTQFSVCVLPFPRWSRLCREITFPCSWADSLYDWGKQEMMGAVENWILVMSKSAKSVTSWRSSATSTACVALGIFFMVLPFNFSYIKWRSAFLSVFVWFVWVGLWVFLFKCPSFIFFLSDVFHDEAVVLVFIQDSTSKWKKKILVFPGSIITMEHKKPTWEGSANICIFYLQTCGYFGLDSFLNLFSLLEQFNLMPTFQYNSSYSSR